MATAAAIIGATAAVASVGVGAAGAAKANAAAKKGSQRAKDATIAAAEIAAEQQQRVLDFQKQAMGLGLAMNEPFRQANLARTNFGNSFLPLLAREFFDIPLDSQGRVPQDLAAYFSGQGGGGAFGGGGAGGSFGETGDLAQSYQNLLTPEGNVASKQEDALAQVRYDFDLSEAIRSGDVRGIPREVLQENWALLKESGFSRDRRLQLISQAPSISDLSPDGSPITVTTDRNITLPGGTELAAQHDGGGQGDVPWISQDAVQQARERDQTAAAATAEERRAAQQQNRPPSILDYAVRAPATIYGGLSPLESRAAKEGVELLKSQYSVTGGARSGPSQIAGARYMRDIVDQSNQNRWNKLLTLAGFQGGGDSTGTGLAQGALGFTNTAAMFGQQQAGLYGDLATLANNRGITQASLYSSLGQTGVNALGALGRVGINYFGGGYGGGGGGGGGGYAYGTDNLLGSGGFEF